MEKKLFDYVIGNPPYQGDRIGNSKTATPIYNEFMDAAFSIGNAVELITPARFLFNAGGTPKNWNTKMLQDPHFKVMNYESDASKIFSNTDIKGGVAITYRDNSKNYGPIEIYTTYPEMNSILKKILPFIEKFGSLMNLGFVASKFNTDNLFNDYPEYIGHERRMSSNVLSFPCFHSEKQPDDILIFGVKQNQRSEQYINTKYVDMSDGNIKKYKIITPKADGNGTYGDTLTKPLILPPNSGFTHTFLGIGGFDTNAAAENALKYIKTKFARCLLGILKITQDMNADKWKYVPLLDFSNYSDINWDTSINEIDAQLFEKFGLNEIEINFIKNNIKPMH